MSRLVLLALLGAAGCASLPKAPQTLDDWFALAKQGQGVAQRLQESERRRASCEAIATAQVVWDEERAIGGAAAVRLVQQSGGLVLQPPAALRGEQLRTLDPASLPESAEKALTTRVALVGKNLAAQSTRPSLPWVFGVLKSEELNAWAAPGGIVLVSRGLLSRASDEAALAGVLAHEIAHVTERHALKAYQRGKARACSTAFVAALGDELGVSSTLRARAEATARQFDSLLQRQAGAFVDFSDQRFSTGALVTLADSLADDLVSAGHSHDDELAADREATRLLVSAGYDPAAYRRLLAGLPRGGVFARHPEPALRAEAVTKTFDALKADARLGTLDPGSLRIPPLR